MTNLIVLTGPTASGKSELAVQLAEKLNAEIVNADSVSIYQDFDIGSGKPSTELLSRIKHHLVSTLPPTEVISAGLFCKLAGPIIEAIVSRDKPVIICGGTGLYINALLCGLIDSTANIVDAGANLNQLALEIEATTVDIEQQKELYYQELLKRDAETALSLSPRDNFRVKRALELWFRYERSVSEMRKEHAHANYQYRALVLSLEPNTDWLYQRINQRVDQMLADGLLDEVREIIAKYGQELHPLTAIGYRHMLSIINNELGQAQAVDLMKRDTRRYAKRQKTWWRNQPEKLGWIIHSELCLEQTELTHIAHGITREWLVEDKNANIVPELYRFNY